MGIEHLKAVKTLVGQSLGLRAGIRKSVPDSRRELSQPLPPHPVIHIKASTGLLPGALHYLYEAHVVLVARKLTF
ncbi:hypothetical protein BT67DRAFT_442745 [Trichocladium antarcticum]|uniref:Uncharacterized protein n=1 Tax=Trichocladium antarcticum TaxID=1450529 RepID=A0AAN6UIU8_9PEZI|nr:hypothetical protein BT67DRAFT_442745 [Trichocladium antarcticum]